MMRLNLLIFVFLSFVLIPVFPQSAGEWYENGGKDEISTVAYAIPYDGAFGVNLGDPNDDFLNWEKGVAKGYDGEANQNNPSHNGYTDAEMVGLLEITDAKTRGMGDKLEDITVSVSCSQGFDFVSQSNPSYRRPFELILIPKGDHRQVVGATRWDRHWTELVDAAPPPYESGLANHGAVLLSSNQPEDTLPWVLESHDKDIFQDATGTDDSRVYAITQWFDVVLNLPGEINTETDVLTYNNSIYPLIEADDYSALVTLTISWGDYSDSVTIPFTGYYDKDDTSSKSGGTCSMFVTPYAAAAHLSVDKDRGTWVPVGWVEFLMNLNQGGQAERPLIFASSSSNPSDPDPDRFRLWHEDVLYGATPTSTNGIYFDVQITDGSQQTVLFDGTMNFDEAEMAFDAVRNDSIKLSNSVIIPAETSSHPGHLRDPQRFYSFSGEIDVRMETGGYMPDGIYSGTVYIHMVTVQ